MKTKLLVLFVFCFGLQASSQCSGPPPPMGLSPVYGLDYDNDGYAVFDMQYYIDYIDRPLQESIYGVSSSGYNFVFRDANYNLAPLLYTSATVVGDPYPTITQEYTGSGPTFDPFPPCYRPIIGFSIMALTVVPYNQDMDNDGILNIDEDANHNGNLMDDDDDQDGIINLKDAVNNLGTATSSAVSLTIYPNPVTNGVISFESNVLITAISIYDLSGKQLSENKMHSNAINVSMLASGIYFLKFQSEQGAVFRKIVISQ